MKINWKDLTSMVGFISALGGGYYKLNDNANQIVLEQQQISNVNYIRWQVDSLKIEKKLQEIKWELQDSIRIQIARAQDEKRIQNSNRTNTQDSK